MVYLFLKKKKIHDKILRAHKTFVKVYLFFTILLFTMEHLSLGSDSLRLLIVR